MDKDTRERLNRIKLLRKEQKANMVKAYVTPIDENIKLLDKVLRGQADVKQYLYSSQQLTIYLAKLLDSKKLAQVYKKQGGNK